jgi:tetratricopeptide (TPR) repeat protein
LIQLSGVDWGPAVAILLAGLVVGVILARRAAAQAKGVAAAPDRQLADLHARRDALVEQLRSFEGTAEERAVLEVEAATVLRDIDRHQGTSISVKPAGAMPAVPAMNPQPASQLRGFLWGAGTVATVALVVFLVTRSTTERSEGSPVTGDAAMNAGLPDADLGRLQKAVQQNPDDLEARLDLARAYLGREQLMEVFEHSQYVLQREPGNVRALSYEAIVRLAMGQADTALEMLNRALVRDPDSLEARVHLALVHATLGNSEAAVEALDQAMRRHPEERERLSGLVQQIRASSSPPSVSAGKRVEMILELAPGVQPPRGAVLFLVARPEGVSQGAPIAAKRLAVSTFPMAVTLGSEDSMMGGQLTDRLRIDARIDGDGDPATRGAGDLRASADSVALGTTGLRLVLR